MKVSDALDDEPQRIQSRHSCEKLAFNRNMISRLNFLRRLWLPPSGRSAGFDCPNQLLKGGYLTNLRLTNSPGFGGEAKHHQNALNRDSIFPVYRHFNRTRIIQPIEAKT